MKHFRLLAVLGIIFLILSISNVSAQNTWVTKTSMPTARGQAAVVAGDDGLIYVMGGFAWGGEFTTVEAYDPALDTWVTKTPMPQATRGAAVAKGLDGKLYVFGGWFNDTLNTTQIYNPPTDTWALGAPMPTGEWAACAATGNDGNIYVIGGEDEVTYNCSDKVQIYDPSSDTWTFGTPMPTARCELGVIKGSDGLIYAIGGNDCSSYNATSTVEAYDPSTDTWVTKASMPAARLWFGLTGGSNIYAIGGGNGSSYLSVNEEFVSHGDGKIYVIGGGGNYTNNTPPVFDTVFAYDPSTNTWTSIPDPMPTPRRELGAAAVEHPPPPVGGEAYPASKASLLAPWIAVGVVLAGGISWYILRRRKTQS